MIKHPFSIPFALAAALVLGACESATAPSAPSDATLVEAVRTAALPLSGGAADYEPLLAMTGGASVVLLGEATHGTHEFYRERARISRELVARQGYGALLIEGEWPAAERVNRYVRGEGTDVTAEAALGGFRRFPTWMWRNAEVVELVEWLRAHNQTLPPESRVGVYGLDMQFSLYASIPKVLAYLERTDPAAAEAAAARYACFDVFRDEAAYGLAVSGGRSEACSAPAGEQLAEMERRLNVSPATRADAELFAAVQSARVVRNAESFYRTSSMGGSGWNVRDQHFAETIEAVLAHLQARGLPAKLAAWAHNSHVGDARATSAADRGELNVGQLVRQRHGDRAVLVGFTTFRGTAIAAREWGDPGTQRTVRDAHPGSYEGLFHEVGIPAFLLPLRGGTARDALLTPRLQRAIGVVYLPESEMQSHYFAAELPSQFDAIIHFDVTRSVTPL